MNEAGRLRRLEAMGIDVWVPRGRPPAPEPEVGLRVRLAAGDGDWLILAGEATDGEYRPLLRDITAALGRDRCRYGQWSEGAAAGMDLAELDEAGIRHVLALGGWPDAERAGASPAVIPAPGLAVLHRDGAARRELWTALRKAL